MRNAWMVLVGVGVVLRLWLMPVSLHPDIRGHYLGGYIVAVKGDLMGVYDHISRLPRTDPLAVIFGDNFLVYSPLTYWLHGIFLKVLSPFYSMPLLEKLTVAMDQAKQDPGLPWLLVVLKVPYLVADIICFWVLTKILKGKHTQLAAVLWALNLPLVYSAYMMGQFDIFIVLFAMLAVQLAQSKHSLWAAVALAASAGFKPFALFLLPFLPGKRWLNVAVGAGAYLGMIAPYALTSPGYRMYAMVAQHSDKLWYAKIPISGGQSVPLFMLLVVILFWVSWVMYKKLPIWAWLSSSFLVFYSVVHYHPQWFSWATPFLILGLILKPAARLPILVLFMAHLIVVFSFDNSLNFGLVGLPYSLNPWQSDATMSLVRGVLAATSLSLLYFFKEDYTEK